MSRLGFQLWSDGLPAALGPWVSIATSLAAVGILYVGVGLQPAYSGLVLLAPWILHAIAGSIWNAVRIHQAYHQFRSMLVPFLVLLVVPYAWWRLTGSGAQPQLSLIILV